MTEEELRALIAGSQREGFRALSEQYSRYAYTIIWKRIRYVGTIEDAEECVSDVFADVFLHFSDIRKGALQGYIATAAERTAIDKYRSLTAAGGVIPIDEKLYGLSDDTDIAADAETAERDRMLYDAVRSLGEPDASLLIHKYYYGRNSAEIAGITGMSSVAVRVRLSRALKKLKKLLPNDIEMR